MLSGDSTKVVQATFQLQEGGSIPTSPHNLVLREISLSEALTVYGKWHYLGKIRLLAKIHYGVYYKNFLLGCISLGSPNATELKGYFTRHTQADVWEIKRLALSDVCPKNSESRVIGVALKLIKKRGAKLVISYADSSVGHTGTIYKATGFEYKGLTAQKNDFWVNEKIQQRGKTKGVNGIWKPRSRKHLFIKKICQ